jgi:ParE-like toxin of type II bacterial toxin-antitoxin system
MRTTYKKAFAQFVKKASKPLQLTIEIKVAEVCSNPKLGQQKLGDLQGVFVYKQK